MSIPYIQHLFYGSSVNQQNCQRNNARFPLNIFEKEGIDNFSSLVSLKNCMSCGPSLFQFNITFKKLILNQIFFFMVDK